MVDAIADTGKALEAADDIYDAGKAIAKTDDIIETATESLDDIAKLSDDAIDAEMVAFKRSVTFTPQENELIKELERRKTKFSKDNILFITKDKTGQIVWLETGSYNGGLKHTLYGNGVDTKGHANDFKRLLGLEKEEIIPYLKEVITNGDVIENTLKDVKNRKGYTRKYLYKGECYIVSGIGTNGFLISAYPKKIKK